MTNNDLQSYIEATQQAKDLKKQFDVLSVKLDRLKEKAKQMISPDDEAIFQNGADFYRVYLDCNHDIQIIPIRCI